MSTRFFGFVPIAETTHLPTRFAKIVRVPAKSEFPGTGLWATVSTGAPFHMEGGKGTTSKVMKIQLRPDPLAK